MRSLRSRLFPPCWLVASLVALAVGPGCSSDTGTPTPTKPETGQIGAACSGGGDCANASCLTDPSFPGGYCYKDCKGDASACPDGATCHEYLGYSWCFDGCDKDEDCRAAQGYHCEYGVCRPSCTNDRPCQEGETCRDKRCKPPCKTDDECAVGRCQDGDCVPPCKSDAECVPGYSCDKATGRCKAKAGKQMGEACTASSQCATGYCLPTRKICSVKCTGVAQCPKGYACGLEKLDKDQNGTFDGAESDCVPEVGPGGAGSTCAKDDDCAAQHCYDGFCLEGCQADADCGTLKCSEVRLLVGGAIPTYRGCLPQNGVSQGYELGTFKTGDLIGVDIPAGAASFILTTEVPAGEVGAVGLATDPAGNELTNAQQSIDQCAFYSQPNRYYPSMEFASLYVPNTPTVKLTPGIYQFYVSGTKSDVPITVRLSLKLGKAQKGTLDINWFFLNLAGTCIPAPKLDAASAPSHAWFKKLRTNLQQILTTAKVTIGKESYSNINNATLDVLTLNDQGPSPELDALFSSSKGKSGPGVNIFLVREINAGGYAGGIVLGIAGGIPGPAGVHGTIHSGTALSVQTACFEQYGYNPGHTLAHEIGHYLGLFHNLENVTNPGYDETQGQVVCPCPCGANMLCEQTYQGKWCRGADHIPDTQDENSNLMYFAAENTQQFSGNQLSAGQMRVVLDNPLVGH